MNGRIAELKGPIRAIRYVHAAILTESEDLGAVVTSLAPDDTSNITALRERMTAFDRVLKTHEDGEDFALFPALEERFPYIAGTYEFDHKRHREHGADVVATLDALSKAQGSGRGGLLRHLDEQVVVLDAFMHLHIGKENELLFPVYDEIFTPQEQESHAQSAQGRISPEEMGAVGGWMFQRLNSDDREAFLRDMSALLPPEAFRGMTMGLSRAVSPADWQEVQRRMPELQRVA
jgi:hemerythrin-like domain-containing protein